MVRFVLRHFAADERFARNEPSPEIPLTLPFSGIFGGFSARYSYTNHSQDHGQWQVCMCVCVCVVEYCVCCAVLCYICSKNMRKSINMENKTGSNHGHNVVRKCKKHKKHWEHIKTWSPFFGTIWPSTDRKKGPKTAIFPDALFLRFPWDLPTIFAGGPIPNDKKALFRPRS